MASGVKSSMIAECPLFAGLSEQALQGIDGALFLQTFETGAVVFPCGAVAKEMYFVVDGGVEIRNPTIASGQPLATINAGGFFGEIGVIFQVNRQAEAVVSQGPCRLAVLLRTDLHAIADENGVRHDWISRGMATSHVRQWFISRVPLFAQCLQMYDFISCLGNKLQVRQCTSNDVVLREGEEGNTMFFLFDGAVEISSQSRRGAVRKVAPDYFGEVALLYSERRTATVRTTLECHFYVLSREDLHATFQEFPQAINAIYDTAQESAGLKEHFIRKISFFRSMAHNKEFITNVSLALKSLSIMPGDYLMHCGDASDGQMFAIAHGHFNVMRVKEAGAAPVRVAGLSAGDICGEVAMLLDTPRVASVVALGHCHVYSLARDAFETLAVVYPEWWRALNARRGPLLEKLEATGVAVGHGTKSQTHGLAIPVVKGVTASTMLSTAMAEQPKADVSIPDELLCLVCRTCKKDTLSKPCLHISSCAQCHAVLKSCPLCRAKIEGGQHVFF